MEKENKKEALEVDFGKEKYVCIPYCEKDENLFLKFMENRREFYQWMREQEDRESKRKKRVNIKVYTFNSKT